MKLTLTIDADSADELRCELGVLLGGVVVQKAEDYSAVIVGGKEQPASASEPQPTPEPEPQPTPEPEPAERPETDSQGVSWDERIHASSKALNTDGTWRRRRGVDDSTVAAVEAELSEPEVEADTAAPEPVAEQAAEPEAEPDVQPGTTTELPAWNVTMQELSTAMRNGVKAPSYLQEVCKAVGIKQVTDIKDNAEAHRAVRVKLAEDGVINNA